VWTVGRIAPNEAFPLFAQAVVGFGVVKGADIEGPKFGRAGVEIERSEVIDDIGFRKT
jgi:hypothetical protein